MFFWLFDILRQIFLDDVRHVDISFSPKHLTSHYTKELWKHHLDDIYVATEYVQIESHITRYKYFSERDCVDIFVDLLSKLWQKYDIFTTPNTLLVPVPMHWSRYFSRGFDHTAYIVRHLSKYVDIPYKKVLKARYTSHQSHLSRIKRLENKKNSFKMNYSSSLPETVILFDDVISTGSTADEAARALKAAWVKHVIWIFLASNL